LIAVVVVSTVVSFQNYTQQLSFESLQGMSCLAVLESGVACDIRAFAAQRHF